MKLTQEEARILAECLEMAKYNWVGRTPTILEDLDNLRQRLEANAGNVDIDTAIALYKPLQYIDVNKLPLKQHRVGYSRMIRKLLRFKINPNHLAP